ncbi:MAG: WD40 repeat domain-containing protein, partial [Burkholderiales bacterium]|nr:WD40 repeat domain-containing protein [Anaerolineae bacterium]
MRVLSTVRLQSAATFPHMTAAAIAFHPDGYRWVSLSSGTVYLWDGTNQRYKVPLKHRTQDIRYSPDGNT